MIDYYARQDTPTLGSWLNPGRFDTIIGLIFLLIVLLSPDGLIGIGQRVRRLVGPALGESRRLPPETAPEEQAIPEEVGVPAAGGHSGSGVQEA